ncbi:DUF6984 family protein [Dyadobacter chenhuakuii]|uniref:DUF6984 domain-containing protein n=1 Tax=Dyadobacter chenhuakuii TaxID=2909339 RepID=A0A9X1QEF0_9BACT|nr:hypothetical protein [Dyadobacter chenhuakuii]MCF2491833.1 hypothetical protein [Dyadobacter chenhuakuii]MCF2498813.1 hypothetical protein [Dyadobacter chenhuakuii]USJ29003.1 hypothetical protein NFI80_14075 [Dyadobacter chenhuakuii]
MSSIRPIRQNEIDLIHFLLQTLNLDPKDFPINNDVDEYEGGKMGSISLGGNVDAYEGDLIQAEYVDSDGTPVVITLTKDTQNHLLDLDFWKVDFSKLIDYPRPDQLIFSQKAE